MKREELIWEWSEDVDTGTMVYIKDQADEVMDKMEMRIKKLEAENEKLNSEYAYYYVAYTVNEYGKLETVPKYFHTIDEAKEEMKLHSNFYEAKGTGYIYGVKFTVPVETVCVFEK